MLRCSLPVRRGLAALAAGAWLMTGVPADGQVEINGLIIDESRTMTGREFYRDFFERWGDPNLEFPYNIVIRELPDARWGSILSIDVNGTTVWRKVVRPRTGDARKEARESIPQVRRVLEHLRTIDEKRDGDLVGDGY